MYYPRSNGTYSTPICNPNISKQLWMIKKISNQEELEKILPEKRRKMGRPLEETSFPFHLILSSQDTNYALNYEGGGLSTRLTANYDGQKWDVSTKKIPQDPLPTQNNNKFTSLNPEHNMSKSDASISSYANGGNGANGANGANGGNGANGANGGNGEGVVNLNVNLDRITFSSRFNSRRKWRITEFKRKYESNFKWKENRIRFSDTR